MASVSCAVRTVTFVQRVFCQLLYRSHSQHSTILKPQLYTNSPFHAFTTSGPFGTNTCQLCTVTCHAVVSYIMSSLCLHSSLGRHVLVLCAALVMHSMSCCFRSVNIGAHPWLQMLDEIQAGIFDGWTYEDIEKQMPQEYAARKLDKLKYRCDSFLATLQCHATLPPLTSCI